MYILGISAYYHDSAACLVCDGKIVAAAQEERFTRKKHDASFPARSVDFCMVTAGISVEEVDYIVFYDKPIVKFDRLLETYISEAPRGFRQYLKSIPVWLREKLYLKKTIQRELLKIICDNKMREFGSRPEKKERKRIERRLLDRLAFAEHHQSHAASAFFPSPFDSAAILTIDGVGEWVTTSLAAGDGNEMRFLKEIKFPHSLGLLYSAFTYYCGFKVNSGEYKLMGLAPYGSPVYSHLIKDRLIDIKDDGSFRLDMDYFDYATGFKMTNRKFEKLFDAPPRLPETAITQREMDIAASIQGVTEEIMIKLAEHARELTGCKNLCLAGGVALNCVGNGKIIEEKIFDNVWIQPASGDAGGAVGAALAFYYQQLRSRRTTRNGEADEMNGSFLGPAFTMDEIREYLDSVQARYKYFDDEEQLIDAVSNDLVNQKVVGWHQGKMEFGPRSLGHRSIIGDPRNAGMQSTMNLKIKYRESFRPFAPAVLREKAADWFQIDVDSPYMLLVAEINDEKRIANKESDTAVGLEKLSISRSKIPAVTHVDFSARVQTIDKTTNPLFHRLVSSFDKKTGCPVVVNTSFNVRGEPIVCTPEDSYTCFMRTDMDVLVIGNFVLNKRDQPEFDAGDWKTEFQLD